MYKTILNLHMKIAELMYSTWTNFMSRTVTATKESLGYFKAHVQLKTFICLITIFVLYASTKSSQTYQMKKIIKCCKLTNHKFNLKLIQ